MKGGVKDAEQLGKYGALDVSPINDLLPFNGWKLGRDLKVDDHHSLMLDLYKPGDSLWRLFCA